MKLINPILLTLNNTLHIKADNLEPVEVDSSCVDELKTIAIERYKKWQILNDIKEPYEPILPLRLSISELSDRIDVREVNVPTRLKTNLLSVKRAFLLPEKEDKKLEITDAKDILEYVKFAKSYTIEEIEKALNKTNYNEGHPLTNKFIGCFFGELTKINNLKK